MTVLSGARMVIGGVMIASAVAGCTANPYVEAAFPRPGVEHNPDGSRRLNDNQEPIPRYVKVPVALEYVRALQDAYTDAATGQSRLQVALDTTLIGTAAAAIGIAATGGQAETAGLFGIGGGALGLAGTRWLNAAHKRIYLQGALALGCVTNAGTKIQPNLTALLLDQAVSSGRVEAAKLDEAATGFEVALAANPADRLQFAAPDMKIAEARMLADQLRQLASAASSYLQSVDPLGQIFINKAVEIRGRINEEIGKAEPELISYNDALKALLKTRSAPQKSLEKANLSEDTKSPTSENKIDLENKVSTAVYNATNALDAKIFTAESARDKIIKRLNDVEPSAVPDNLFADCKFMDKNAEAS